MRGLGYDVKGGVKACEACKLAKANQKAIARTTVTIAKEPAKRMFVDISGPFTPSIGGAKYWLQIVNEFSRIGFCFFMKAKSKIGHFVLKYINKVKKLSPKVKYI